VLNGMPIFSAVFWADSLIALSVFMRIVVFVKFIYYSIYIGINMSRTINKYYGKALPCRRLKSPLIKTRPQPIDAKFQ